MTQEEFNDMLLIGLGQVGLGSVGDSVDNTDQVPVVSTVDANSSMPMVVRTNGVPSGYVQIYVSNLLNQLASQIDPSDVLSASDVFDDCDYNSALQQIEMKHGSRVVATIDASPFVIDGMVDDVDIENGNLVITFNAASGKMPISIPLTDIFNPANYYTKTQVYNKTEADELYAKKLEYEKTIDPSDETMHDEYQRLLAVLYQSITDAQNAKADYVGDDMYIYRWNTTTQEYDKTNLYVKGDPGVTDYNQLTNRPNLQNVALTGDYRDLNHKPTIPTKLSDLNDDATHRVVTDTEKTEWGSKADGIHTHTKSDITNFAHNHTKSEITDFAHTHTKSEISDFPSLSPVATSGSYDDLDDKPAIPTVPTNVSAFINDAGYLTKGMSVEANDDPSSLFD